MSIAETIMKHLQEIPESAQAEVLNFIKYLKSKTGKQENKHWSNLSLFSLMRGIKDKQTPYSLDDLKESYL